MVLPVTDTRTEELCCQFIAALSHRSASYTSIHCTLGASTSPTGYAHSNSTCEVSLVKAGAEGHLVVPNMKMHCAKLGISSIVNSSSSTLELESNDSDAIHEVACSPPLNQKLSAMHPLVCDN